MSEAGPPVVHVTRHIETSRNYVGGQSLIRLRFDREHAIASEHLNGQGEARTLTHPITIANRPPVIRGEVASVRRLTQTAKDKIAKDLVERKLKDRENCVDPPYMAPSPDPNDYSHVGLTAYSTQRALSPPSGAPTATISEQSSCYAQAAGSVCAPQTLFRRSDVFRGRSALRTQSLFSTAISVR